MNNLKNQRHQILLPKGWGSRVMIMHPEHGLSGVIRLILFKYLRETDQVDENGRLKDG